MLGLSWHPEEPSLLLSLHYPSTIIQWDTATGNKVPHYAHDAHDTHTHHAQAADISNARGESTAVEPRAAREAPRRRIRPVQSRGAVGGLGRREHVPHQRYRCAPRDSSLPSSHGFNAHHFDMGHYVKSASRARRRLGRRCCETARGSTRAPASCSRWPSRPQRDTSSTSSFRTVSSPTISAYTRYVPTVCIDSLPSSERAHWEDSRWPRRAALCAVRCTIRWWARSH